MFKVIDFEVLEKEFQNKSIAVIGNAQSLFDYEYGNIIDNHDLVIRINLGFLVDSPKSHGTKTDWVIFNNYNFLKKNSNIFSEDHKFNLLEIYNLNFIYNNETYQQDNFCRLSRAIPLECLKKFQFTDDKKPSTGLCIVYMLSLLKTKQVSIFGFDFKRSITWYNKNRKSKKEQRQNQNDWKKEEEVLNWLCNKNKFKLYRTEILNDT